jgi:malate dehydrogenase (oxaloacetate-decarboxylating)
MVNKQPRFVIMQPFCGSEYVGKEDSGWGLRTAATVTNNPFKTLQHQSAGEEVLEVSLAGHTLLDFPLLNKGSAFTDDERLRFDMLGLLPPHVSSIQDQVRRNYENFRRKETDLDRYVFLSSLQDRNETLFYRLIQEHISEMIPIIYTPVVGIASQSYSHIYRRPRGLYISYPHRAEIETILGNAARESIRVIVVTDGERILGLGDLGVGGMGIPIGKLSLYTLCAGVHPASTLPILLDVGTDNQDLLADPLYLGWRHERLRGQEYDDFVDAFVQGVKSRFPHALLQWEDFSRANARRLLDRYRGQLCSFNDDIQGTGAVTLAGLMAAVKVAGSKMSRQRVVILGAGSAATGVADNIVAAMVAEGLSNDEARSALWLIDLGGLLHSRRTDLESFNSQYAQPFERLGECGLPLQSKIGLAEVVRSIRPTVLIGLSAQGGAFTEPVVRDMAKNVGRPIIFPLSNPTERSEAAPSDLLAWTEGRALIATGSPFPQIVYAGRTVPIGQCNNVYIFPGMGLGVIASGANRVTDQMFIAAARALGDLSPALADPAGSLFPPIEKIREVSFQVAVAVGLEAQRAGLATKSSREEVERLIRANTWEPRYARYVRASV